ncbi:hypothetical protein CONCODRAFT_8563 [Conidiobolus coronatus NRRL 28638]|uniref:G-protein coupled receptors family 1 profile domain-containing protein n=1 Tax=Conidiobolus coronatus (strain ATCC 28846 / CBS 209.66 / NRRL 28638) TaxID=796925 RepID=A0A137P2A5_CONC2|nr:hypothetical protein CONCODRAFT_8563 [Conidiobolus coronatus NRRL 28638]|eukprot:KXN69078.1 hypothetical protein CONCODRAFT_8563 [Conidiobolus coronatus NRRL 28638]
MYKPTAEETYANIWPNPWAMPIIYFLTSFPSFILGTSIIYVVLKYFSKNMHIDMKLGLILVILDTLSSLDFIFTSIASIPPIKLYVNYHGACIAQVAWASTTFVTSMNLIGVIALERCLLIVYNIKLKDIYYWIMVLFCYLVPLICFITTVSTDSIEFQVVGTICHYGSHSIAGIATYLLMMFVSSISSTLLIISYIKIVYFINAMATRQQMELGIDPEKAKKEANKTTFKLMLLLIINVSSNFPYCILQFFDLFIPGIYTPKVSFFIVRLCVLDIFWNSVIFLILHTEVWDKMKEVFWNRSSTSS